MNSNRYRAFAFTDQPVPTSDGGIIQKAHGCNGKHHVHFFVEVFYEKEKVVFAKPLGFGKRSVCDGSCGDVNEGGFFYRSEDSVDNDS